jgi:DNA-binding Lrp family transcriptional regulator
VAPDRRPDAGAGHLVPASTGDGRGATGSPAAGPRLAGHGGVVADRRPCGWQVRPGGAATGEPGAGLIWGCSRPVYAAGVLTAFVLIHAEPDRIADLGAEIADVDGVAEVYSVTGDLDLVAIVRVRQHDELADVVTGNIAALPGIVHTTTMIAFRAYSRHDLESMFGLGIE